MLEERLLKHFCWLLEVPMAVGGGVLSTCNYKARQFGVRSGMAGHIAKSTLLLSMDEI